MGHAWIVPSHRGRRGRRTDAGRRGELCGDPAAAGRLLDEFWADNSASAPWEQLVNASAVLAGDLQQFMVMLDHSDRGPDHERDTRAEGPG